MSRPLRLALGALLAALVLAGIAALSRVPLDVGGSAALALAGSEGASPPGGGEGALIRLSWRARGELVRECRRLSDDEIAALPAHMRRTEVCEGSVRPYRLRVSLDGRPVVDEEVQAAGARQDRPIYVFHDLPVPAGSHQVTIGFTPERGASREEAEEREDEEHDSHEEEGEGGRRGGRSASGLELAASLRLQPGDVALITRDPVSGRLIVRLPQPAPPQARP